MKFSLDRIIIKNRSPFQNDLDLSFKENGIIVLTSVNGKGKTTLLSYIMDAWVELTKNIYSDTYKDKENFYYRISSSLFDMDSSKPSMVYIRFKNGDKYIDYIDIRNKCAKEDYLSMVPFEDRIPFEIFSKELNERGLTKEVSSTVKSSEIKDIFNTNVVSYFPSYRYEVPNYLNDPYNVKLSFNTRNRFSNELPNPIEVITGINGLVNWIMDIVIDGELYKRTQVIDGKNIDITPENKIWESLQRILREALSSKYPDGNVRFAIGKRNKGASRVSVVKTDDSVELCPTIFNLSTGELALICIFAEILRQGDNLFNGVTNESIQGIVLVDEIDKHLHIKLQKESLPKLLKAFPNVQFILSSHSPFMNMGLADECLERSTIIDFDNGGINVAPTNNAVYQEAYEVFLKERNDYATKLASLHNEMNVLTRPIIITEGKTDLKHILKAMEKLGIERRFDILQPEDQPDGWSNVDSLINNISKTKVIGQPHKVIAIFDRDIPKLVSQYPDPYKQLGNNAFAFCIPCPESRKKEGRTNISIEYLYSDDEIHALLPNNTHLFFGNEFKNDSTRQCISDPSLRLNDRNGVGEDKIIENNGGQAVYDAQYVNHLAKKNEFADAIQNEYIEISKESWENFRPIIDIINSIIDA